MILLDFYQKILKNLGKHSIWAWRNCDEVLAKFDEVIAMAQLKALKKLYNALARGEASARDQGWISLNEAEKILGFRPSSE